MPHIKKKTQSELARELCVSRASIIRWRKDPTSPESYDADAWREWLRETGKPAASQEDKRSPIKKLGLDTQPEIGDNGLPGLCAYDDLVLAGTITYVGAKAREEAIGKGLENERRKIQLEVDRGSLVPKADAIQSLQELLSAVTEALDQIPTTAARELREHGFSLAQLAHVDKAIKKATTDAQIGLINQHGR